MSGSKTPFNLSRRGALAAGAGALSALIVRPASATSETMQAAIREFSGGATIKPGRVTMDIPPLVENGNSVPLTITVDSPMTEKDFVKTIAVFNERNPQPNIGTFHLSAALRPRLRLDAHPARQLAEHRRGGAALRRHALVRLGRADRHAARLRGELTMARALINVPPKAKRGEIIEIKTLISHPMETGYRPKGDGTLLPARHHPEVRLHAERRGDLPRRSLSGDRRQSLHRLHDGRARGRPAGVLVDRRSRRSADGIGEARGRMTIRVLLRGHVPAGGRRRRGRAKHRQPPLRLRLT